MTSIKEQTEADRHVHAIACNIEDGIMYEEGDEGFDPDCPDAIMSGWDYLSDVLDIEYRVNSDGLYRSAKIMVAYGGPTIWVDFLTKEVNLYWWGTTATGHFSIDAMGIEQALQDLWESK